MLLPRNENELLSKVLLSYSRVSFLAIQTCKCAVCLLNLSVGWSCLHGVDHYFLHTTSSSFCLAVLGNWKALPAAPLGVAFSVLKNKIGTVGMVSTL